MNKPLKNRVTSMVKLFVGAEDEKLDYALYLVWIAISMEINFSMALRKEFTKELRKALKDAMKQLERNPCGMIRLGAELGMKPALYGELSEHVRDALQEADWSSSDLLPIARTLLAAKEALMMALVARDSDNDQWMLARVSDLLTLANQMEC